VDFDYILDVSDTPGVVTISNIRLTTADIALRVDNADVTLLGDINLNFYDYYGIEMFNDSHLDVTGATFTNINDEYQHPTIKQYGADKKVTYIEGQFGTIDTDPVNDHILYYLKNI
jgi:hypothetical protein